MDVPQWYHQGGWLVAVVDEGFSRGIERFSITNCITLKKHVFLIGYCKECFFSVKSMCLADGIKPSRHSQGVINNSDGPNFTITNEFTF